MITQKHFLRSTVQQLLRPPLSHSISLYFYSSSKPKSTSKPKPKVAVAEYLIKKHKFSPEAALKASSKVAYLKTPENSDSVLSFFKQCGFSQFHLEEIVKRVPRVLRANVENAIKPKIKIFQDLGFLNTDIADVVASDPWILFRSADNRLGPAILVLKNILGSNAGVLKVLKLSGWYLKYDLENILMPNIKFLNSIGIKSAQIVKYIFHFPRFFVLKQEYIMDFVKRVDEMGFDRESKMFLPAIRVMSSMTLQNWELKVKLFRSLGLSEEDVLAVFRRAPQVFCVSEKKIKDVTELLLNTGKLDISFVVEHPELLISSVEKKLKPRLRVIKILEKKNLLRKRPKFTTMCQYSEQKFAEKFVVPYINELED